MESKQGYKVLFFMDNLQALYEIKEGDPPYLRLANDTVICEIQNMSSLKTRINVYLDGCQHSTVKLCPGQSKQIQFFLDSSHNYCFKCQFTPESTRVNLIKPRPFPRTICETEDLIDVSWDERATVCFVLKFKKK